MPPALRDIYQLSGLQRALERLGIICADRRQDAVITSNLSEKRLRSHRSNGRMLVSPYVSKYWRAETSCTVNSF